MKRQMKGLGISPGLVLGELWKREEEIQLPQHCTDQEEQLQEFFRTIDLVKKENRERIDSLDLPEDEAEIFEAHQLMLEDPEWIDEITSMIRKNYSAAYSVTEVSKQMAGVLEELEDEYLAERARDIRDIAMQLTRKLGGADFSYDRYKGKVLWMEELLASEVQEIVSAGVLGVLTHRGGRTSHSAILAKSFKLPYISGISMEMLEGVQGQLVALDAGQGILDVEPSPLEQEEFFARQKKQREEDSYFAGLKKKKTTSLDGKERKVCGNIAGLEDIPLLLQEGAEGVALFRTEFLFLKDQLPGEVEQVTLYRSVFSALKGLPITVRTFDIGGDKASKNLSLEKEDNPFLGLRGIRLSFVFRDVLKTQLRAILQAARGYQVKVMFPMISSLEDLLLAKEILEEAKEELMLEGIDYQKDLPLGIMIEIPSAALSIPAMAKEISFISLGTNDLIQYTLAADRLNRQVEQYYDGYNPGLLRLIYICVQEAKKAGIDIAMCGDLAGEEKMAPLWNAMGIEEYGVVSSKITRIRHELLKSSSDAQALISAILAAGTSQQVREILHA